VFNFALLCDLKMTGSAHAVYVDQNGTISNTITWKGSKLEA